MSNQTATTAKWVLDSAHSELLFKVKHLMISNVKGEFKKFNMEISGDDFRTSNFKVVVDSSSIYTNNDDRDTHLKSADFFDAENHKEITFVSTRISSKDDENYTLTGLLTIKDVSKEITLDVEYGGSSKDPWGNEKAGFSVIGKINRSDFGLKWNAALETGGVLVSEEVKINAEIQLLKQA